jgi:signal transduction histidine kinase
MRQLVKSVFVVMLAILTIMTLFEMTKQLLFPVITLLQSHVLTVLFSTLVGTAVSGYAMIKYKKINRHLGEQILERERLAAELQNLNEALELKVQERTQQLLAAQDELVRTEKLALLGLVADTVGHELRNPLGVINNAVYFLQTVLTDADEITREYLGIIKDEIANAERIVSDLLDAVRTKPPHPKLTDVAGVMQQTLKKCDVPSTVCVQMDIPQTLSALFVDPMQIYQVFWNLITNGIEAMPNGGELKIRAVEDPVAKAIIVSVEDNGCGMTPEQQGRLFQPLFTTKARRVGLGLVVVKNLTQINGGSVSVQSTPGEGSVFSVTLPADV